MFLRFLLISGILISGSKEAEMTGMQEVVRAVEDRLCSKEGMAKWAYRRDLLGCGTKQNMCLTIIDCAASAIDKEEHISMEYIETVIQAIDSIGSHTVEGWGTALR